jgi:hypothetical protein
MSHKVRYQILKGPPSETDINAGMGACDQVIIHSIIGKAGDGKPRSEAIVSMDGDTGKSVTDEELFESWVMMAKAIVDSSLGENTKALASMVFEVMRHFKVGRCLHHPLFVRVNLQLLPKIVAKCLICGEDVDYVDPRAF